MKENIQLGLKENWQQFSWLVIINAFVGGMVGLERSILPQLAESEFGIASKTALLSFIIAFGITKSLSNYFAGRLANRVGRKNLLVLGWLFAIPVPLILIYANNWNWVVFANILLGINQGLTWSSTVVMKIDLVGDKMRGLAMGINEFAGYFFVGLTAFLTGYLAAGYGVRPVPFYLGVAFSFLGLALSFLFVKDTVHHVHKENQISNIPLLKNPFWDTTIRHKSLSSVTQAGLVNNLNDGMIWGLLPLLLFAKMFDNAQIGILTAVYPTVWGISQLFTGKLSDHLSKRLLLFWGMMLQAFGILVLVWAERFWHFVVIGFVLGIGTALVYPTFLAAIAEYTNPTQRAESLGVFRLWRDLGYAVGAILTGITADLLGINSSIVIIAVLTAISGLVVLARMEHTKTKIEQL